MAVLSDFLTCGKCKHSKSADQFHRNMGRPSGKQSWCKKCAAARGLVWQHANKAKSAAYSRKHLLKTRYGMTEADFAGMRAAQGGACGICREPFTAKPHVDHCHSTGLVRSLLCASCNLGLGHFRDTPKHLLAAVAYLQHHQSTHVRNLDGQGA